jgi:acyl transferase domain-containing protein
MSVSRTRVIRPVPPREAAAPAGATAVLFPAWRGRPLTLCRALYGTFPAFRAAFDDVCRVLDGALAVPLAVVVFAPEEGVDGGLLAWREYGQSALFAYEVALYRLWQDRGGQARAVAGDGVGALAAAYVTGALPLRAAATRSITEREPASSPAAAAAADRLRCAGHAALWECGPAGHGLVTVGDVPALLTALAALHRPGRGAPAA